MLGMGMKARHRPDSQPPPRVSDRTPSTHVHAALAANRRFYGAMRAADLDAMDDIWSRQRPVSCAHPGRPPIFGREAVMESWRVILSIRDAPDIRPVGPHAIVTGRTALVVCREEVGAVAIMASNTFVLERGDWRMVSHLAERLPHPGH